jgi:hypothetical protein
MKKRLFVDADTAPTEALLRKQLGKAMDFYAAILQTSGEYRKQWQYSRGNGWLLKVDDMRKAMYYLIAFDEGIEISLTVRDHERAEFLGNDAFHQLRPQLDRGTKYPEGYALRFEIETPAECASVARFLTELMRIRSAKGIPEAKRTSSAKLVKAKHAAKKSPAPKG